MEVKDKLPMFGCEVCWTCRCFEHGDKNCSLFGISIVPNPIKSSCIWWEDEEDKDNK